MTQNEIYVTESWWRMKKLKDSVLDLIELLTDDEKGEIYLKLDKILWQKTRGELEQEVRNLRGLRNIEDEIQKISVELIIEQSKSSTEYNKEKVITLQNYYKELVKKKERLIA